MRLIQCLLPSAGDDDAPDPEALPPPSPRLLPGLRSMLAKTASAPLLGSAAARAREQVCISQRRSKYIHAVLLNLWGRAVDALGPPHHVKYGRQKMHLLTHSTCTHVTEPYGSFDSHA